MSNSFWDWVTFQCKENLPFYKPLPPKSADIIYEWSVRNDWVTTLVLCFWKTPLIWSEKMELTLLVYLLAIICLIIPLSTAQVNFKFLQKIMFVKSNHQFIFTNSWIFKPIFLLFLFSSASLIHKNLDNTTIFQRPFSKFCPNNLF